MDKLVKWLEDLIRAQKKSRAWRTFVSCLAAIVVFTTTYSLILPAITVESTATEDVGGLVMEGTDAGSTGAQAEASGDVVTVNAENEIPEEPVQEEAPVVETTPAEETSAETPASSSETGTAQPAASQPQTAETAESAATVTEEVREPVNGEVQTIGDKRVMTLKGDDFDVVVSGDLSVDVSDRTVLSVRGIADADVAKSFSDRISDELLKIFVDTKTTEVLYQLVFTDENLVEYTPAGYFDVEFIFHRNTVSHTGEKIYAAIYDYLTDEMVLAEKNGDEYETPVISLDEYGIIKGITLKGMHFDEYSDIITLVAGPVNEELKLAAEKKAAEAAATESKAENTESADSKTEKTESADSTEKTESKEKTDSADKTESADAKTDSAESKAEGPSAKTETSKGSEAAESGTLTARGTDYTVTLSYGADAKIPTGASLEVSEIENGTRAYKKYLAQAKAAMGLDKDQELPKEQARFFDIKIMADGKEVQPSANVSVNITYDQPVVEAVPNAEAQVDASAVHFGKEGAEVVAVNDVDASRVEFEAESFSVYGVIYTVDFEYTDPTTGQVYFYSLEGGKSINLTELLVLLGIRTEENVEEFVVKQIENVEFSNPDFVKVTRKGKLLGIFGKEDWKLESLKAFATEELLTISLSDGSTIVINVTDAQYTSDLNSLLTGITVTLNGEQLENGDSITVDKGDQFALHLELKENDSFQFQDDTTGMVYQLPEGINLGEESFTKYITVDMKTDGKVYRNPLVYDPNTNTLTLSWNTKDPNFKKLTATDNAAVVIDLSGYFNEDATHVDFGLDLEVDVKHVEHHEANVEKDGQLYLPGAEGNPYGNIPAIKYTVTVTSDGTTTVNVNDTVEGTAVKLDTGNWTATSNKGTTITPTFTEQGFTLNNQSLQDGEVVTITYWGTVDTSKVENLLNATYQETGNKVTVSGEGIPEKEVKHFEHEVGENKMDKTSTNVSPVDKDGNQTVTWKIVANSNPIESIGGSTITDRISYNSLNCMSYSGSGISVVAKRANGSQAFAQAYDWNTSNLTLTQTNEGKNWVFTIPETTEPLTYEITYTTIVDTKKFTGTISVVNETEGKPGKDSGSATVGVPEGTDTSIVYSKKAVDVTDKQIVWNIPVNIEQKEGGYSSFVLDDTIPNHAFGNIGYTDDIESVSVEGLEGSEWYSISYKHDRMNDNAWKASGHNTKPTDVVLTFYKDGKVGDDVQNNNGGNDTTNPGLNAATSRTLTVTVVTNNSTEWLDLAASEGITHQDYLQHTNTAKINNLTPVSDTVSPMEKVVYKMRDGKIVVSGPNNTANAYTQVSTPGGTQGTIVNSTKVNYPTYKFWVVVGGVAQSNLEDGKLVIEDEFDPHFRVLLDGEDKNVQFGYGTSPTSFSGKQPDTQSGESFYWTQSDGKATFTIENPSKNGDNYYPYYMVEYWLVPKSPADYEVIKELTLEEGGKKIFTNRASSGTSDTELGFEYEYNIIDKSSKSETDPTGITLEKYTIKINPEKAKILPEGENSLTMTDTYSRNLSVDFSSIHVSAEDKNGRDRSAEVTWDYSDHVGTFTIPDETYVVITYSARVIGDPGSAQTITNTAYMEGYSDTVTETRVVDLSGGATAERVRIRLFKFAEDHMEGGLDGAQFRLLDQDKNPIINKNGEEVIFTTGIGYIDNVGNIKASTDVLNYTYDQTINKYVVKVGQYNNLTKWNLNSDGQVRWDNGEIENPTDDTDKLPTYEDLNDDARQQMGINIFHGFAEIAMSQKEDGVALKKERTYYLEEVVTPVADDGTRYEKDFIKYSFLITDQSDYSAPAGVYVYHNNDILTVRNKPTEEATLKIAKTFKGNVDLTDEQKNKVTFKLQKQAEGGSWVDYPVTIWDDNAEAPAQSATFTYGDHGVDTTDESVVTKGDLLFKNGVFTIKDITPGTYRVIESNAVMEDTDGTVYTHTAEYLVDGQKRDPLNEEDGVSVTVTEQDIDEKVSHDISITNSYFTNKYKITKVSSSTAQVLSDAKFSIIKVNSDGTESGVVSKLGTNEKGEISIQFNNNSWDSSFAFEENTLYYIIETEAPEGYLLPEEPEKNYFYFSAEPEAGGARWSPVVKDKDHPNGILPEGESATDIATGFGSATIPNKPNETKTYVKINKKWVDSLGKDITDKMDNSSGVTVSLYRTTGNLTAGSVVDGEDEDPKDVSDMKVLTVKWGSNQETKLRFIPGDRIQITMTAAGENATIQPSINGSDIVDIVFDRANLVGGEDWSAQKIKSWLLTTKSAGDSPKITITNNGTAFGLSATNLESESRVYKLTQEEAEGISGSEVKSNIILNKSNDWTQTVGNLDLTDSDGNPYFYYIVESEDDADETTRYEVGSKEITVINTEPETGSVKVQKFFEGITYDELPQDFKIMASWMEDETSKTAELTIGPEQPENVTMTGEWPNYTWEIAQLPLNTPVTFKETGYEKENYKVTVDGSSTATDKTTATAVASQNPGVASFTNTYTKLTDFEFTKVWHNQSGQEVTWEDNVAIHVEVQRKIGDGNPDPVGEYTITKTGERFTISSGPNDPELKNTSGTDTFKIENLPKTGTIGSTSGEYIYYVTETEAVNGYKEATYSNPPVGGSGSWTSSVEYALNGGKIINKPLESYELPSTGGPGTRFYYSLGIAFIAMAGIILFIKRKEMRSLRGEVVIPGDED